MWGVARQFLRGTLIVVPILFVFYILVYLFGSLGSLIFSLVILLCVSCWCFGVAYESYMETRDDR